MSEERMSRLKELIDVETEGTVLSVFCRTDPRDPANTGETPGWQIALKNGLKAAEAEAEANGERAEAMRKLGKQVEDRITGASAHDRGRSVAMFLSADTPFRSRFVRTSSRPITARSSGRWST
jgi:hypothetical protein